MKRIPRPKTLTGSQRLEQAYQKRMAAEASGVSHDDYMDGLAAEVVGLSLEEFRAAVKK